MRIVIDLQGAQSSGSRNRGIGRYTLSLAQAIVRNKGKHEIIIALNGLFSSTIEPIRAAFDGILPQDQILVWYAPNAVAHMEPSNTWRRKTAEHIREAFLASLKPDIVYITSLFEGAGDDAIVTIGSFTQSFLTAVTLYDLIPLINRRQYLANSAIEAWYESKLDHLKRADLLLAISGSSRQESIDYFAFPPTRTVNIGTAADSQFKRTEFSKVKQYSVRSSYGLSQPFVMYTGGIDLRKNIEGLIRAFALLPPSLLKTHQLAVVCSIQPEARRMLGALVKEQGLAADKVIFTDFVPEDDLIALYHLCEAFVFPSWHEGFGLPALEAMSCGAPVIAANTSSLPEVVGRGDALFDPYDDKAIAKKLIHVLTDKVYRNELIRHGLEQAKKFSWDNSAKLAIKAFEELYESQRKVVSFPMSCVSRPKLAYISPLPSERSGIADYSAELLPELARYYEIDVVIAQDQMTNPWIKENCAIRSVEWFINHAHLYERVLYHFGNSEYHQHMFDLLELVPGIVVLHDFFLSGITAYRANQKWEKKIIGAWENDLYQNHGYSALADFLLSRDVPKAVSYYPCNKVTIGNAQVVIVHSDNSRRLATKWLGERSTRNWEVIPLLRIPAILKKKTEMRQELGLAKSAFVVCSFGFLGPTKQSLRLLRAWLASPLSKDENSYLIFAGDNDGTKYGVEITSLIRKSGLAHRIRVTGWLDKDQFQQYLWAADLGVQLRTLSRGETSAAVLDCMNYGLPTIVNANGAMADLPTDAVWMLPDEFADIELSRALTTLWKDKDRRHSLGQRAREIILTKHSPRDCAKQYAQVIENNYAQSLSDTKALLKSIVQVEGAPKDEQEWVKVAQTIASNKTTPTIKQLLVDVSGLITDSERSPTNQYCELLMELLLNPPAGFRVEPIYAQSPDVGYRYARQFTFNLLGCSSQLLDDDVVTAFNGDIFLCFYLASDLSTQCATFCQHLRTIGARVYSYVDKIFPDILSSSFSEVWPTVVEHTDGMVFTSHIILQDFIGKLTVLNSHRLRPLNLAFFDKEKRAFIFPKTEATFKSLDVISAEEQAKELLKIILEGGWNQQWMPDNICRIWGNDTRLGTQVGKREGWRIESTNQSGYLIFGPYMPLTVGQYRVVIVGEVGAHGLAGAKMDVVCDKGNRILGEMMLVVEGDTLASLPLLIERSCSDFEVRVWVEGQSEVIFSRIEIHPLFDVEENELQRLPSSSKISLPKKEAVMEVN